MRLRRGISYISSVIIILALVSVGAAFIYNYLNNTEAALARQVEISASAISTNTTYIELHLRNIGTQSVSISGVYVDGINITSAIGLANFTLNPGQSISRVVSLDLPSGDHVVKIIFTDGSEKIVKFTS